MKYIQHRVNQVANLKGISAGVGVEIDLRSELRKPSAIHLSHDAWKTGDDFRTWLEEFKKVGLQGPLILNTKEDGLEETAFALMREFEITNFLFLDTALPTLVRYLQQGRGKHFFVRHSSYEPTSFVEVFKGQVDWVWVDCFRGEPLDVSSVRTLRSNFKLCLVSPELQQREIYEIERFKELAVEMQAICTKNPAAWREILESASA